MLGQLSLALVGASALFGIILYALAARGRTELVPTARAVTYLGLAAMFVACGVLLYDIFTYQFQINYVYEHASRSLSKPLLFSVFYASQEGSFMLWGLWTALIAIFLIPYARRQRYEPHVMALYLSVLLFIAIMLIAKSPFESIYSAYPGEAPKGWVPPDGKGLNPSLENLWIVIHPPMLFLGFALLAVPFAFALAGLIKRDYQGWVVTSMPWTLGAAMVLGFGVMLGGFWAYETLGWGGFWAWDPVENASLLPWLITVAAVHTMLTQKRTGGLIKTNISLTLLAYALVMYGSFLTRSGKLGEASVHSFADPGNLAFSFLFGALVLFTALPMIAFLWRWREMSSLGEEYRVTSRETALSIASALLVASALVVFIGTSAPLVQKKVDTDFYNNLHIPIVIVMMLINGLSLLLKWKQSDVQEVLRKSVAGLVFALLVSALTFWMGVRTPGLLGLVASAAFALFINLEVGWKILRGHWRFEMVLSPPAAGDVFRRIRVAIGITALVSLVLLLAATAGDYNAFLPALEHYGLYAVLAATLLAALFLAWGYPRLVLDTKFLGAYVAHFGLAVFILGVVASAGYTRKEILRMPLETSVPAFGGEYTLRWTGNRDEAREHTYWLISIHKGKDSVGLAQPLSFMTDFNKRQSPILNPGIVKFASRDLYFTLTGSEVEGGPRRDTLHKQQEVAVVGGKLRVRFISFDFPAEEKAKMFSGKPFHVKAEVEATIAGDANAKPIPLTLGVTRTPGTEEAREDDIIVPGTSFHVQLAELKPDMQNPANSRIVIRTFDANEPPAPTKEVITVEAFIKPYINLVWAGILTLVVGFGFSVVRRRREALVALDRAERAFAKRRAGSAPLPDAAPLAGAGAGRQIALDEASDVTKTKQPSGA